MAYVAAKTIRVQVSGGGLEIRYTGDPVPEAAGWLHAHMLEANGYIKKIPAPPLVSLPTGESIPDSFECGDCGKRLRTAVGLKRHVTSVHKRIKA